MKRFTTVVDVVANLVIIGLGVVVIVLLYQRFTEKPHQHAAPTTAPAARPPGPSIGATVDVGARSGPHVVVAMSSGCGFCDESVPELKKLVPRLGTTQVVYAFPQRDDPKQYVEKSGLPAEHVWSGDFRAIGVRGTPTVLLVDRERRVAAFWEGRLTPARTQEIVAKRNALR